MILEGNARQPESNLCWGTQMVTRHFQGMDQENRTQMAGGDHDLFHITPSKWHAGQRAGEQESIPVDQSNIETTSNFLFFPKRVVQAHESEGVL